MRILYFFMMVVLASCHAQASTDEVFVGASKEVSQQVELFEFDTPLQQKHAILLAKSLRCPQCQNQNLVESNSPIAKDLRLKVFTMVKEGKSEEEIIEFMTDRFGDLVMYKPAFNAKNLLLWIFPLLLLILFLLFAIKSVKKNSL
ncbi:heme lyase NrfEFG subunit NrfF [Vibrio sp. 03-59-1]|nr:heme lyase NrfEFG subunit NrfF [Vibrio sp. 03-59-1]